MSSPQAPSPDQSPPGWGVPLLSFAGSVAIIVIVIIIVIIVVIIVIIIVTIVIIISNIIIIIRPAGGAHLPIHRALDSLSGKVFLMFSPK